MVSFLLRSKRQKTCRSENYPVFIILCFLHVHSVLPLCSVARLWRRILYFKGDHVARTEIGDRNSNQRVLVEEQILCLAVWGDEAERLIWHDLCYFSCHVCRFKLT